MLKVLYFIVCLFLSTKLYAENVEIKVLPAKPSIGESFEILFEVETNQNESPVISFDSGDLDILGKQNRGIQISTVYINGRLNTKRTLTFSYEMVAPKAGYFSIKDIKVQIGSKTLKHKNLRIQVYKEKQKLASYFLQAEATKTDIYLGEGINVGYYLYFKVNPPTNYEILEFPKLKRFLNRTLSTRIGAVETVEVQGEIFRRQLIWLARLYPQKEGTLRIDPIALKISYRRGDLFNPFSNTRMTSKRLRSKVVKVNVQPLPAEGVPPHFTGLVGKHQVQVSPIKEKYLVNEAVEFKVSVKGPGALEKYDGPRLYSHPNLEAFDTKAELNLNPNTEAEKAFEYTYLARGAMKIDQRQVPLSFFDPDSGQYITENIDVPAIEVVGGAVAQAKKETPANSSPEVSGTVRGNQDGTGVVNPFYEYSLIRPLWPWICGFAFILMAFFNLYQWLKKRKKYNPLKKDLLRLERRIKDEGLRYGTLFQLVHLAGKKLGFKGHSHLTELVEKLPLRASSKEDLKKSVWLAESKTFHEQEDNMRLPLSNSIVKELKKVVLS